MINLKPLWTYTRMVGKNPFTHLLIGFGGEAHQWLTTNYRYHFEISDIFDTLYNGNLHHETFETPFFAVGFALLAYKIISKTIKYYRNKNIE